MAFQKKTQNIGKYRRLNTNGENETNRKQVAYQMESGINR